MKQIDLDADLFCETVGFFFAVLKGSSTRRTFGGLLTDERGWRQKIVLVRPPQRTARSTRFLVFVNPQCSIADDLDLTKCEKNFFFGLDGEVVARAYRANAKAREDDLYRSKLERLRMKKSKEAQKVLTEGIFNMVRKNRETLFQRMKK